MLSGNECKECGDLFENCNECDIDNEDDAKVYCDKCDEGYVLKTYNNGSQKCKRCDSLIKNCADCGKNIYDDIVCYSCIDDLIEYNNECK